MSTGPTIPFIKGDNHSVMPSNYGTETAAKFNIANYESMKGGRRRRHRPNKRSARSTGKKVVKTAVDEPFIAAGLSFGGKRTRSKRRKQKRTKKCSWFFF